MDVSTTDLMEELVKVVDKYADELTFFDISKQLISYGTQMMLSVSVDELSGIKGVLDHITDGLEKYEQYHL